MRAIILGFALAACTPPPVHETCPTLPVKSPNHVRDPDDAIAVHTLDRDATIPLVDRTSQTVAGFVAVGASGRAFRVAYADGRTERLASDADATDRVAKVQESIDRFLAHGNWVPMIVAGALPAADADHQRWTIPEAGLLATSNVDGRIIFEMANGRRFVSDAKTLPKLEVGDGKQPCFHARLAVKQLAYDPATRFVWIEYEADTAGACIYLEPWAAYQLRSDVPPYPARLEGVEDPDGE